jgi:hypothetical protein
MKREIDGGFPVENYGNYTHTSQFSMISSAMNATSDNLRVTKFNQTSNLNKSEYV